jgi:hypothetical protein
MGLISRLCFIGAAIAFILFLLALFGIFVVGSAGYLFGVFIVLLIIGIVVEYLGGRGGPVI